MCQAFLQVKKLGFTYAMAGAAHVALQDINLTATSTDFVAVVGPSGCGKSTLLNIIAGYLKPTHGSVLLDGQRVCAPGADRGVVFQRSALFPWMNVRGNVEFGLKLAGQDRHARQETAMKYLKLVGLDQFGKAKVYELSGGMKQRVEIARALANDPRMLLMDEPMGALDALTRERVQDLLLRVWRETKKMMFLITHNVEEAVFLGTKVIVMTGPPGRFVRLFEPPFSRSPEIRSTREVKSSAEFIAFREQVLDLVLSA